MLRCMSAHSVTEREECVILGFRHDVAENSTLLDYYAENSGNLLPTFQLSRNVGKKLPLLSA